ncbi:MAG: DUF502 domain-containing protein [candidate division Zixibacteria bacterium]|nr:DUF502 domain-containing protein [candidate division Zixibacteria bacterium]
MERTHTTGSESGPWHKLQHNLKRTLVTGLITLVPVAATFIVLRWVLVWMDSFAAPVIHSLLEVDIPGLGILLTLALIYIVGFVASSVLGKPMIAWSESMLMRLPVVKIVYNPVKKLLGTFAMPAEAGTWKTVLVEYPRRDAWMIAFVAGEIPDTHGETDMVSLFIPNTPNPAAGRVIIVPRADVRYLDIPLDDAIEFVVSGGTAISPSFVLPPLTRDPNPLNEAPEKPLSQTARPRAIPPG